MPAPLLSTKTKVDARSEIKPPSWKKSRTSQTPRKQTQQRMFSQFTALQVGSLKQG
jgi:hypothetical protein